MYIAELFHGGPEQPKDKQAETVVEANQTQLVVLYPGRFQPFHLGHADVFRTLQAKFGRDNTYIATSNVTDAKKSPFNFTDKTILMHAAGVPSDRVLEVQSPYKLPAQFDPTTTVFVVAIGAPDADRLRPDSVKKDGNPGYYKTFKSLAECETADKHGYVVIAAERHKVITLKGQQVDVSHGTPSRAAWNMVRNDPEGRNEYMIQMFGRADVELGRVLDKIPQTTQATESINMNRKEITQPIHPEELDDLITSVGQKAKQGPMKTVWNPVTRKYKVVPAAQASLEEDDMAPMTREEYNSRRKALQQIQMDPELTRDPTLRKELIKKIAQLTMQARAAGVLPESVHAAHVQENRLFEAKAIVNTVKYLKESVKQLNEASPLSSVGFSDEFINAVYRKFHIDNTTLPDTMTSKPKGADLEKFVFLSRTPSGKAFAIGKGKNGWNSPGYGQLIVDDEGKIEHKSATVSKVLPLVAKGTYYAIPYSNSYDRVRNQPRTDIKRSGPNGPAPDSADSKAYAYMEHLDKLYGPRIRAEMEKVVDFIYANMRKFGQQRSANISGTAPQERVLKIANTLEALAKDPNVFSKRPGSWDQPSYMEQYLNALGSLHHGFASIPNNYHQFTKVMDETPAGLAKFAKFILSTVHAYEEQVKELLYKDTTDALKQQY